MENKTSQIKKEYPNPISVKKIKNLEYDYCVGGAVCMFMKIDSNFPGSLLLAKALRDFNLDLSEELSIHFAREIIYWNDKEDFEMVWKIVGLVEEAKKIENIKIKQEG